MARRKGRATDDAAANSLSIRKLQAPNDQAAEPDDLYPLKRRRSSRQIKTVGAHDQDGDEGNEKPAANEEVAEAEYSEGSTAAVVATPTRRKRGRPRSNPAKAPADDGVMTPTGSRGRKKLETPLKTNGVHGFDTPSRRSIADRSARRKSARALIDRVVADASSDDEAGDEELEREIYESSQSEEDEEEEAANRESDADEQEPASAAATPSKRPRGRPRKTAVRKKSPTPPRDLPPHEQYFYQNKPGSTKTSGNTLSNLDLLTHEEYFSVLRSLNDPHEDDIRFLQSLHVESFPQWAFELSEGFSLCLYGYGSKRPLLHQFAKHLHSQIEDHDSNKIIVINGYVRTISVREILTSVGAAIDPSEKVATGNPMAMVQDVLSLLSSHGTNLTLILNSIDAPPLRKQGVQSILAQLASHPQARLICSADTPDFSLLWDSGLRSSFNFVFHDCTTFSPFGPELDVVDEVHELLGRKARRIGGKDGVTFVLRSLPENAKSLFRLLVSEVLVSAEDDAAAVGGENAGVEYRMLYNKAVEEFICSSEMAFRTLLKEFHDHQMVTSRKDILGTELLSLPFGKEELEAILEDLMT